MESSAKEYNLVNARSKNLVDFSRTFSEARWNRDDGRFERLGADFGGKQSWKEGSHRWEESRNEASRLHAWPKFEGDASKCKIDVRGESAHSRQPTSSWVHRGDGRMARVVDTSMEALIILDMGYLPEWKSIPRQQLPGLTEPFNTSLMQASILAYRENLRCIDIISKKFHNVKGLKE